MSDYCMASIYSPDGFSRPCGLPLEDGRCMGYPDEHEHEDDGS